jgi:capsular polysaccharide biosynthesis protein
MELREYWNVARKRGWIIVLVAIVAAVAALGVSLIIPKTYRATIQLSVEPARADWGLSQAAKELLANYIVNIRSHTNVQDAINRGQLDMTTDQFLADLDVSYDASNLTITLQADSHDEAMSMTMAQQLADVFVEKRKQWNEEQDKSARIYVEKVDDVRYAVLHSPKWKFNVLAGAIFGAIAGGVVVFFLEWLQADILRTPGDVEKSLGLTVLGAIPVRGDSSGGGRRKWGMPAWIEPGILLVFVIGLAIGAGLGALVVGLL